MTRRRKGRRNARRRRAQKFRSFLFFYAKHLLLWCVLILVAYWIWIDRQIAGAFETRSWDLPARVYAQPLELYEQADRSLEHLTKTLERLGYRAGEKPTRPGEYLVTGDAVHLFSRGFVFSDGVEPSRNVIVSFGRGKVRDLVEFGTGRSLALVRLEPWEMGTLHASRFEDRVLLSSADLPEHFIRILLAVEDRRFYEHFGVDIRGIFRALLTNLRAGEVLQGGSTLTQQLVKNLFLSRQRTVWRKFNEALMAISVERRYDKAEILEAYVNAVYLGQEGNRAIHGFGLASDFYFGRPLAELNIPEIATLVGLIKGPSLYNPYRHHDRAVARRDLILSLLKQRHLIDESAFEAYRSSPLKLRGEASRPISRFPWFMQLVRTQLLNDYDAADLKTAGLKVFTTLDPFLADALEAAIDSTLRTIESERGMNKGALQVGAVVTDPDTAQVLAVSGGRNARLPGFNRAVDARRPIGSLVKPFVYMTALSNAARFNVMTLIRDDPVSWEGESGDTWTPRNYDGVARGAVPLYEGLAQSMNLATVNLGLSLTVSSVAGTLRTLGFDGRLPEYPSLFLGALDASPLEVAQLYQVLAAGGFRMPLRTITAVTDQQNRPLKRYGLEVRQVVPGWVAYLTQYLLTRAVDIGTARAIKSGLPTVFPLAGKTGTSNDLRDSWFAGYGDDYLAVVWVGYDDNRPTGLSGSSGAMRIWINLMKRLRLTALRMNAPDSIEWGWMMRGGTALVSPDCQGAMRVPLHRDHLPPRSEDCGVAPAKIERPLWRRIRGLFR